MLWPALYAEAILAAGLAVAMLGHNAWLHRTRRRQQTQLQAARTVIYAYLAGGDRAESATHLRRLPFAVRLQALTEFYRNLAGEEGQAMAALADATGIIARGRALCRSRFWWRRLRGLTAVALSEPGTRSLLISRMLGDRDPSVRAAAAALVPAHATPEVIAALVCHLDAADVITRFAVLDALVRCGVRAGGITADWLQGSPSPAGVVAGLLVLERVGDTHGLDLSLRYATHPEAPVREQAARTIGVLGDAIAAGALTALLRDPDPGVRQAACRSAGRLQWPNLAPDLGERLADPDWRVRRRAAVALRRLGASGEAQLMQALWHTDRYAADMARHVLDLPLETVEGDAGG